MATYFIILENEYEPTNNSHLNSNLPLNTKYGNKLFYDIDLLPDYLIFIFMIIN